MPFGQVPVLFIDDQPLSQSGAIERLLASQYGFAGADIKEAAYCEMVTGQLRDIFSKLPFMEKDPKVKVSQSGWCESLNDVL